jgi:uncharacterized SAM-dependent methyltransferase
LQTVRLGEGAFDFAEGEPLVTEYSHKYTVPGLRELAQAAGLSVREVWRDERKLFAVAYLSA